MSYGRTFHVFVPDCLPATLIIIPYRPEIVNHKLHFLQKSWKPACLYSKDFTFAGFTCVIIQVCHDIHEENDLLSLCKLL